VLITSVMVFLSVFLLFGALVTAHFIKDPSFIERDIFLYGHNEGKILVGLVLMWIMMAISLAFVVLDGNLVFFHVYLISKGLTTFQYILIVEERKDYKRQLVNFL